MHRVCAARTRNCTRRVVLSIKLLCFETHSHKQAPRVVVTLLNSIHIRFYAAGILHLERDTHLICKGARVVHFVVVLRSVRAR